MELKINENIITAIVNCVNDVPDIMKEDIRRNGLKTQNSTPTRIWDHLNTALCNAFNSPDCMSYITRRGCWQLVMVYEKESGNLYTLMRESRFLEVQREIKKGNNKHYVYLLARHLNNDLLKNIGQQSFLSENEDEKQLKEAVEKIFLDLNDDGMIVKRHVLVLFESDEMGLHSIRAVMVDSNLDIVLEQDWSEYISIEDSIIVEKTEKSNSPAENPSRGLELTKKATLRKENVHLLEREHETNRKSN